MSESPTNGANEPPQRDAAATAPPLRAGNLSTIALRTSVLYALLAALWILGSDRLLYALVPDPGRAAWLATFKGWAFVAVTAGLLYVALRRQLRRWEREASARRQAEDAARQQGLFVALSRDLHLLVRLRDSRVIAANDAAISAYGYTREELIGYPIAALNAPDSPALTAEQRARAERDGLLFEAVHRRKDGRTFPVEVNAKASMIGGESVISAIIRDITARKQTELKLRDALAEAQRFRAALDHVTSFIYVKDLQSRYVYANQATLELFGCSAEELVGRDNSHFFPPATVERLRSIDGRVFRGEQTAEEIDVADGKGGRRVYWEIKTPIFAESANKTVLGLLSISTDITERKRAEEALLQRGRQLEVLSRISQQINAVLETPVVLRQLVAAALKLTGATGGAAGRMLDGRMIFAEYNLAGQSTPIDFRFGEGHGVPGWVMQTRAPYLTNDAEHDPHVVTEIRQALSFRNLANVPIFNRAGALLGCFEIHNKPGGFDDTDLVLLQGLAASGGIALENATILAELTLAEERARANEERYRSLFENMLNGFAYCRMVFRDGQPYDFIYLAVNRAFETLTGLKDVVGRRVSEVIPGIRESDSALLALYGRVAESGRPEYFETYVVSLRMWFAVSAYCPREGDFVAVFDVITDRKQAEATLRDAEARYRLLFVSDSWGTDYAAESGGDRVAA